jgi:hypothetical protein
LDNDRAVSTSNLANTRSRSNGELANKRSQSTGKFENERTNRTAQQHVGKTFIHLRATFDTVLLLRFAEATYAYCICCRGAASPHQGTPLADRRRLRPEESGCSIALKGGHSDFSTECPLCTSGAIFAENRPGAPREGHCRY